MLNILSQALVAHACNPSYTGGRDQEDRGSKPAQQIVRETLSQKHPTQKRSGGVSQGYQDQTPALQKQMLNIVNTELVPTMWEGVKYPFSENTLRQGYWGCFD
jgi:hypothetical protein